MVRSGEAACREVVAIGVHRMTDGRTPGMRDLVPEGIGVVLVDGGGMVRRPEVRRLVRGRRFKVGASRAMRILTTLQAGEVAS